MRPLPESIRHALAETRLPLAPLPMSTQHFASLREANRALALTLDQEGIAL